MRRAKKVLSPILRRLISSTRRAERSMSKAIALTDASNHRIERKNPKFNSTSLRKRLPLAEALMHIPNVGLDSDFERR